MINIETTMEKIARIYSKNTGVEILTGEGFSSDSKTKIFIPPISDQADKWIRFMTEVGVYHKLGHILYTDADKHPKNPRHFKIWNSLEDIRIEKLLIKKWPGMKEKWHKFLKTLLEKDPQNRFENPNIPITKKIMDLTYLAAREREIGNLDVKNIPDDLEDLWHEKVDDLFDRICNATKFDETMELSKELYHRLKDKQPPPPPDQPDPQDGDGKEKPQPKDGDPQDGDPQDGDPQDGDPQDGDSKENSQSGKGEKDDDKENNSKEDADKKDSKKDQDKDSGDGKEPGKQPEPKPDVGKDKEPKPDPLENLRKHLSNDTQKDSKIDSIGDEIKDTVNKYADTNHTYRVDSNLKDHFYKQEERLGWQGEVGSYEKEGRRVTAYVGGRFRSLFISERAQRWMTNLQSGKLDTRKIWNDDSNNIFRRRSEYNREDSAVSLVIDNSGSMRGNKSFMASSILTALAGELDRVRVPFECLGFTAEQNKSFKNSKGIRTEPIHVNVIKTFNEAYRRTKHRFVWPKKCEVTVELDCIKYAVNNLIHRRETKKVLFVLCDGKILSGSVTLDDSLRKAQIDYIKRIERAGIHVVGFGIQSDSVAQFYSNHIIVNDLNDFSRTFFNKLSKILIGR